MELTNKKIMYSVTNSSDTYKLNGSVTMSEDSKIENLSGNINKDSESYGNFYYTESSDNKININLSGIPADSLTEAEQFIITTVNEIKNDNK